MKAILLTAYGDVDRLQLRDVPEPTRGTERDQGAHGRRQHQPDRLEAAQRRLPRVHAARSCRRSWAGTRRARWSPSGRASPASPSARASWGASTPPTPNSSSVRSRRGPRCRRGMDLVDAGAYPLVLLTGAQLIEDAVRPARGDQVLVTGATGSTGRVAVFVAKAAGARVLAGVRAKHKAEAATLGADQVVALDDDADVARLPTLDAIADTVGGETTQRLLGKLKAGRHHRQRRRRAQGRARARPGRPRDHGARRCASGSRSWRARSPTASWSSRSRGAFRSPRPARRRSWPRAARVARCCSPAEASGAVTSICAPSRRDASDFRTGRWAGIGRQSPAAMVARRAARCERLAAFAAATRAALSGGRRRRSRRPCHRDPSVPPTPSCQPQTDRAPAHRAAHAAAKRPTPWACCSPTRSRTRW